MTKKRKWTENRKIVKKSFYLIYLKNAKFFSLAIEFASIEFRQILEFRSPRV